MPNSPSEERLEYAEEKTLEALRMFSPMTEAQLVEHVIHRSTKFGRWQGIPPENVPGLIRSTIESLIKKGLVQEVPYLVLK